MEINEISFGQLSFGCPENIKKETLTNFANFANFAISSLS